MSERRGRTLILDTNLMILLIVGIDLARIYQSSQRLRAYIESEFDVLTSFVVSAAQIVVTPNTLTETSNF